MYKNLSDKEALALGRQHNYNITSETHLQSKFYDDVKMTRRLFSEIKLPSQQSLMEFNEKMRDVLVKVFRIEVSKNY